MIFDIAFMVVFVWASYRGFTKGLMVQAATLAALVLGIFGAVSFSGFTTSLIIDNTNMEGEYLPVISFALTFIIIVILVHLSARLIEKLVEAVSLGFINRMTGAIFSMTKFAFIISVVLVILNTINSYSPFLPQEKVEKSLLYRPLSRLAPMVFPYLKFDVDEKVIEDIENQLQV